MDRHAVSVDGGHDETGVRDVTPQIGQGAAGDGIDAVTVSTVLGDRDGPVGAAWTTALATPSMGHSPFVVVARPNLPVVPLTLLVPAVGVVAQRHAQLTLGAAQAGVASAVLDLKMDDPDGLHCLIVSVWVGALAEDEEAVFRNTHDATVAALKMGAAGGPWHGHLTEVDTPENDNFRRG
jgi:5,6,7,8-tetrahydromethanopterin hydro-lyase